MKSMDWTALLPGRKNILVFPGRVDAVRSARFFGRAKARAVGSWSHDGEEGLHLALCEAKIALGMGADDICHVGLPLSDMTLVDFPLPAAARSDLDNAVRYALMRHIPFSLDQMTWALDVRESGDALDVFVALMSRDALEGLLERFSRAGLPVASVFPVSPLLIEALPQGGVAALAHGGSAEFLVWSGRRICWQEAKAGSQSLSGPWPCRKAMASGAGRFAASVPSTGAGRVRNHTVRPRGSRLRGPPALPHRPRGRGQRRGPAPGQEGAHGRGALSALHAVGLFLRDLVIEKRRLSVLEDRVASLRVEAEKLAEVRQRNDHLEKRMERWGRQLAGNLDMSVLLKEITLIVPQEAWLDSLQVQERRVVVSGKALRPRPSWRRSRIPPSSRTDSSTLPSPSLARWKCSA